MPYASYVRLQPRTGTLAHYVRLEPRLADAAETEAARHIDTAFVNYNRALWSPDSAPIEIQRIARLVAEAEYLRLDSAKGNPLGDAPPATTSLLDAARALTQSAVSQGYLTDTSGGTIRPDTSRSTSGELSR